MGRPLLPQPVRGVTAHKRYWSRWRNSIPLCRQYLKQLSSNDIPSRRYSSNKPSRNASKKSSEKFFRAKPSYQGGRMGGQALRRISWWECGCCYSRISNQPFGGRRYFDDGASSHVGCSGQEYTLQSYFERLTVVTYTPYLHTLGKKGITAPILEHLQCALL